MVSLSLNGRDIDLMDGPPSDKELAGWSYLKNCGQQFDVQGESSDEWHSSGIGIRERLETEREYV